VDLIGALLGIAGAQVEPVDVLSDEHEAIAERLLELHDGTVGVVGVRGAADASPVEVPGPHLVRHLGKGRPGGHLGRVVVLGSDRPEALFASKRRDAALRADPGAGEEHDRAVDGFRGLEDRREGSVGVAHAHETTTAARRLVQPPQ